MRPNAHIQAELDRLEREWWAGVDEGYEADPNRLPAFYSQKTIIQLTARERGYVVGRELRMSENEHE